MLKERVVLLVDDEPATLAATMTGLKERGFTVRIAEGADQAMYELRSLKPSIIVSDLAMPGTNGFELFQRVRAEMPQNNSVPFVFLTGIDDYYAKKFGRELGGAAYITKPVDLDELEQIIKEKIGE